MQIPLNNPQLMSALLATLLQRLDSIDKKLEKKISVLSVDEAVSAYRRHLREGVNRKGRSFSQRSIDNFGWFLDRFYEYFEGKNVAEITADECNEFIVKTWERSSPGTIKQRTVQLKIFLNFCIQYLKKKGNPIFHNPCDLLDPIEYTPELPEWIPVEKIRAFLSTARKEHHWIAFSILLTAGIRVNDLMHLRKCDIEGRVLRMRMHGSYRPKSGKREEQAVIPQSVADRLAVYLKGKPDKSNIIPVTEIAIFKAVQDHGKKVGLKIGPHSLRKWCASFWERQNDAGMVRFVLRHAGTGLRDRYVALPSIEEAMEKQEIMEHCMT